MGRTAEVTRETGETKISCRINLDGTGKCEIQTGIGFFNHMLTLFAKHGLFDLELKADGDIDVDCHHTVEDTGIVVGLAMKKALGDKSGINRYGSILLPMDETLALCAVDLSGRPYLVFDADFPAERLGIMETETVREFFLAVANACGMNLHLKILYGENTHHMAEAMFKAFARALCTAVSYNSRVQGVPSTKGSL